MNGELPKPEQVEAWIKAQEGEVYIYVTFRARANDKFWPGPPLLNGRLERTAELDGGVRDVVRVTSEKLAYFALRLDKKGAPEWHAEDIPVTGGVLESLKKIVNNLTKEGFWSEREALMFVLTGLTPVIPIVRWQVRQTSGLPPQITLTVDARIAPQALAKEYTKMRKRLLGNRHIKPLTPMACALAVSSAKRDEEPWQELMHKWNRKHPQWPYTNHRNFCRDALAAEKRVLDINYPLCWRDRI